MSKEELAKRYQEIVLKTNGGADDYVVALCQIANLISEAGKEIEKQTKQLAELKAENERLKEEHKFIVDLHNYFETETLQELKNTLAEEVKQGNALSDITSKLEQQLKEKDEEITLLKENDTKLHERLEKIKLDNEKQQMSSLDAHQRVVLRLKDKLKLNTKQVCEKIRTEGKAISDETIKLPHKIIQVLGYFVSLELLTKIEEGENNV